MEYFILGILIAILILCQIYRIKKGKCKLNIRELFIFLFLIYLIVFIKLNLLADTQFTLSLSSTIKQINLIPLFTLDYGLSQGLKSIIIAIPFGFFISLFFSGSRTVPKLIRYGFIISFIIELLQLFKTTDYFDINDIIFNVIGILIGGLCFYILSKILNFINKSQLIEQIEKTNITPVMVSWKTTSLLIISYICSVYFVLFIQTQPLSILDNSNVINIESFEITLEEKISHININVYYKTNFNRLSQLFSAKLPLTSEPVYGVYTLNEPYKPQSDIMYGILIVGWNKDATRVDITYKDTTYSSELNSGLFAISYPELIDSEPIIDIYTYIEPTLSVKFYDEFNNIIEIPFRHSLLE
ncbi:VanZ like family [Turicibacter sanguinis]|nr:VanZ like family [Turicibacter sanguinis]